MLRHMFVSFTMILALVASCANSPCDAASPANPWGIQVGAFAADCPACPPTPTDRMSWSELKSLYVR